MAANEQLGALLRENEELTTTLEKGRNDINVLRIELAELKLANNNLQADLKVEARMQTELRIQITALREQLNDAVCKEEEAVALLEEREAEVRAVERVAGCRLGELAKAVSRSNQLAEEVEVFKREVAFLRHVKHRVNERPVTEETVSKVLADFYQSLEVSLPEDNPSEVPAPGKPETVSDSFGQSQKVNAYEEELAAQRKALQSMAEERTSLLTQLERNKELAVQLTADVEFHRQYSGLVRRKKEGLDFQRALTNLTQFDANLKAVYSKCVDYFVSMDKELLKQLEKRLNDCIKEFKEIKAVLLGHI
jgi:hypothetical protein